MKFTLSHPALLSLLPLIAVAFGEEAIILSPHDNDTAATANTNRVVSSAEIHFVNTDQSRRVLFQCDTVTAFHPNYSLPWNRGKCQFVVTCNSPSYTTELECCKAAYAGQTDNYCISQLANPPTPQPTNVGGPDIYYPDYTLAWSDGKCINTTPVPSGRPTYTSMLACCKAAYGGQMSMACIQALPNPPTSAPTNLGEGVFYPDYNVPWPEGKCINTVPVPSGRPTYTTELACCKAAYGGQMSMACIKDLPNPPTPSPTRVEPTVWYPDYSLAWTDGKCIATVPVPSGRPTYTTQLGCCQAAYGGQMSRACIIDATPPSTNKPSTKNPTQSPSTMTPTTSTPTTAIPSYAPTTANPSISPTSNAPSHTPTTSNPSVAPTTSTPSHAPTTANPSIAPTTATPSHAPTTANPSIPPTHLPTSSPTNTCFPDKLTLQNAIDTYIINGCTVNTSSQACISLGDTWGWPIGTWCTSLITDMSYLFNGRTTFNEDISLWNVGSVTTMRTMFAVASAFNQNIGGWNVSSVTDMAFMFDHAYAFNRDISLWNVGSVTSMDAMFSHAADFNQNIGGWNVGSVTSMAYMFFRATSFNGGISSWDVGSVTNMYRMFDHASAFNQNIGGWNVGSVTHMASMFTDAVSFNGDIASWNVGSVTNMYEMFRRASAFNQNIGGWNVGSVTDMSSMFRGASSFNGDISSWNVGSVTNMYEMFAQASAFNQNIGGWNVSSVTNMAYMFHSASSFNGDISLWNVGSDSRMGYMFYGASNFNQNLCSWKNTIPFVWNSEIFINSGCTYPTTPLTSTGPFCAVDVCPSP